MATQQQLELLRAGVNVWNRWRQEYPAITPDLYGADLIGANLKGANLSRADLGWPIYPGQFYRMLTCVTLIFLERALRPPGCKALAWVERTSLMPI